MAKTTISAEIRSFLDGIHVAKHREFINVRADPRISFIVDTKDMPFRGVAIEGTAELLDDPDGAILESIVVRYLGADGAVAARARMAARGERVILRIRPLRVRPWAIESIETDEATSVTEATDAPHGIEQT